MPITSVCRPSTATAAREAASHGERRRIATNSATSQPAKAASPSRPVSTPSSVYVDSPAFGVTPVRDGRDARRFRGRSPTGGARRCGSRREARSGGSTVELSPVAERVVATLALDGGVLAEARKLRRRCTSSSGRSWGRGRRSPPTRRPSRRQARRASTSAAERSEHQQARRERDERRPRMRPEESRVDDRAGRDRPPPWPRGDEEEQHDDEGVRGRERAEEGRDEPAGRALLVGVQDPVLRQVREAAVGEPELLVEPVGDAGVAPPLERDEVDVDEPPRPRARRRRRRA